MEPSPEQEAKLIELLAKHIVNSGTGELFKAVLISVKPFSFFLGTYFFLQFFPFFETTDITHDLSNIMISHPKEFIDQIIKKVEDLELQSELSKSNAEVKKPHFFSSFLNRIKRR